MAFCEQCGAELSDDCKFCESCGAARTDNVGGCKDLDLSHGYYMTIDGRNATMYMDTGQIVRRFHMSANVVQATTNGPTVTIITDDGYTSVYSWTGQFIRRTKR